MIYKDPKAPVDDRVKDLLSRMTDEEKIGQLMMSVCRSKLEDRTELLTGDMDVVLLAQQDPDSYLYKAQCGQIGSALQVMTLEDAQNIKAATAKSRLAIPVLIGTDAPHGVGWTDEDTTIFASPINMAATFDLELVEKISKATALEMIATGSRWNYSPNVDISRDPRWGRQAETFGEDTLLTADMGEATVKGLQVIADDGFPTVASCLKHLIGGGHSVNGVNFSSCQVHKGELYSSFLPPFKRCIDADAMTIMAAHNDVLDVPCHASNWLLDEILRKDWQFQGLVVSDWGDVGALNRRHNVADDLNDSVKLSIEAGMDVFMLGDHYADALVELLKEGKISQELLNNRVANVLKIKFRLGLFEDDGCDVAFQQKVLRCDEHKALSLESARKSITLLTNKNITLPLEKPCKILITGPNANNAALMGDWVLENLEKNAITVVDALKEHAPQGSEVVFEDSGQIHDVNEESIKRVVASAEKCDVIIVAAGEMSLRSWKEDRTCGENFSRTRLGLFGKQEQLLQELYKTGKPVILSLNSGRALCIEDHVNKSQAVLQAWDPGEFGGQAVAEIIFGKVNPSARLPLTIPRNEGQIPVYYNYKVAMQELTPCHEKKGPLFWFGYGLSYTTFEYKKLTIPAIVSADSEVVKVSVEVSNIGKRAGDEVVLVYSGDLQASTNQPVRKLVSYKRITLDPGKSKKVELDILLERFAIYDRELNEVIEPGEFEITVSNLSSKFLYK